MGRTIDVPLNAPEVLPPLSRQAKLFSRKGGQGVFADENLDLLAHVLDDWFRIPGTSIRVGLDGIIGVIPGIGDILGGLASCILIFAAWQRGLPYVALARMLANVGIEVGVGAIPFVGDAFDIAWKANRRNYKLMQRHLAQPRANTWRDWAYLLSILVAVWLLFLAPVFLLVLFVHFAHR